MNGFRVRLFFSKNVSRVFTEVANTKLVEGCLFYIDRNNISRVCDLASEIVKAFNLPNLHQQNYQFTLDGLCVPGFSPIDIFEKDDVIKMKLVKLTSASVVDSVGNGVAVLNGTTEERAVEMCVSDGSVNDEDEPVQKKKRRRRKKKPAMREVRTSMSQCLAQLRKNAEVEEAAEPANPPRPAVFSQNGLMKRKHIRFDDDGNLEEDVEIPREIPVLSKAHCAAEKQQNSSTLYSVFRPRPSAPKTRIQQDKKSSSPSDSDDDSSDDSADGKGQNCDKKRPVFSSAKPTNLAARQNMSINDSDENDSGSLPSLPDLGEDPWKRLSRELSNSSNQKNNADKKKVSASNGSMTVKFPPKIGTVLSFKMLELSPLFNPEISEPKTGRVVAVDSDTGLVSLDMIAGSIAVSNDDEMSENQSKKATVSWSSMIEPHLAS